MEYTSTRGAVASTKKSAQVIKQGLAEDGGLFVPTSIPNMSLEEIGRMARLSYPRRCADILIKFLDDYNYEELYRAASDVYNSKKFRTSRPAIIKAANGKQILELWHGPTCAFKDMALQLMPRLLSLALEKTGEQKDAYILVATSGDTGKAALEGYSDVNRVKIKVFYPTDGVSNIQRLQMVTQKGENVSVAAVKGNFDDCQSGVKALFADSAVNAELNERGYFLSSANSINWGRLVPQIVYYISAYCDLAKNGKIKLGEYIDVTVPTGNFGNILAAYYAKKMGLPIDKLICASNKNKVLTDFFNTGVYDKRREFYKTTSPSMDILISSNLERLLYMIAGAEKCSEYMRSLSENGYFTVEKEVSDILARDFVSYSCNEEQTANIIGEYFYYYRYLCDPHTAVAISAAEQYTGSNLMLIASTASPYKFSSSVLAALGKDVPQNEFEAIKNLHSISKLTVPNVLGKLNKRPIRFERVIAVEDMKSEVLEV